MTALLRLTLPSLIAGALVGIATPATAQSDSIVYEQAMAQSAENCPGYSTDRARPGIRAVPVGALRVLAKRRFVLCPDRRLEPSAPVVWYGEKGAFAWLPESPGVIEVLKARVEAMAGSDDFPEQTLVWDAEGKPLSGRTLPTFERRGLIVR